MKQYTIEELKAEFARLGYKWFDFHTIGIRSKANLPNKFDDLLGYVKDGQIVWSTGTTNPGTYWLEHPQKKLGCANLVPGQYEDAYALGYHKGKYPALVQIGKVKVYRDDDLDSIAEVTDTIEEGYFGINQHTTNYETEAESVDNNKWSAGCQVRNKPKDHKKMIVAAIASKREKFTYTLLDEF